jgi:hypothetical protein
MRCAVASTLAALAGRGASPLLALALVMPSADATAQRAVTPPTVVSAREPSVPFKVGERLTYDVSWSPILKAGTAVVSVTDKKPSFNSTAYSIVAEGRPIPLVARLYALHYKMDTLLDSFTLLPHRGSFYAEEGSDRRTSITQFDRTANRVFFEEQTATTTKVDYPVPAQTQDGLSTLFALRARTFKAGDRITIPVTDSGALYSVEMSVGVLERVRVPLGEMSAWMLKAIIKDSDGQPVGSNIGVWISNDVRRLPVKLQADLPIGSFVLALREAST